LKNSNSTAEKNVHSGKGKSLDWLGLGFLSERTGGRGGRGDAAKRLLPQPSKKRERGKGKGQDKQNKLSIFEGHTAIGRE